MGALIYFLLGVLFLAVCEWLYLKKFHNVDARHEEPSAVKEKIDALSETASSLAGSASASAASASSKVMEIPAVSKGRAFLERMAAKEAQENTAEIKAENSEPMSETADQTSVVTKQDKTSINTTRAMGKKVSVTTTKSEKVDISPAASTQSTAATSPPSTAGNGLDDLQKVSGIGPKIHQLLQADNINSFDALAKTNVATLSAIMQKAGPRYALADVSSWPEQAKMLSKGELEALEMLQQSLKKA